MKFLSDYIKWHYLSIWPKIIILWRNNILFPFHYFCIPLHLKTLFSPWHRQYVTKKIGFHPDDILGVIFFNMFARVIGAIMRFSTILYGLSLMIILTVIFIIPVFIWPFIPVISLPFYLGRKLNSEEEVNKLLEITSGNPNILAKILFRKKMGKFIAMHLGLNPDVIPNLFWDHKAMLNQVKRDNKLLTMPDLFKYLADSYKPLADYLTQNNLKNEDVYQTALWFEKLYKKESSSLLMDLARIKNLQGVGHDWAYGYTVQLDKYAVDLTQQIPIFPILLHRNDQLNSLQRILIKTEGNNPLIVGEPGVARHLLAEILAYRIKSGNVDHKLSHKRVLSLNMHSVISAKPGILEVKGLAEELLQEAKFAGNVIICIDEIDKYLSEGAGRIDLTDIIVKFAESSLGIIGITNPNSYYKYIKSNSSLSLLFEKVDVEPLDSEKSIEVLEISTVPVLEKKYHLTITYPAVKKVVEDANRYITSDPLPSKAIKLLDETCIFTTTVKNKSMITAKDVDDFLTEKMHIAIGDLQKMENEKLANLENLLHTRIINQEQAISVISSSLRRSRLNIGNPNRPVGSFLFLGPTGVGKTETAKALANIYYGGEDKLNRFDMSQYQKEEGAERLIGSIKLGMPGELTSQISDSPFSVLLLDEFEKADRQIFNLFLTLLDEGYISDATGRKVMAKNNIIIATSNAGAEFIRERINQGISSSDLQKELIEYVQQEKIFSPELLNRFDAVIVFTPLSEGNLREVARLQLTALNKRLSTKDISVAVTPELINKLAIVGYDPQFGGRAMRRTITEIIEDQIAKKLLAGNVKKGEKIEIDL